MSADGGAPKPAPVRITLYGRFSVRCASGQDLTPTGAKAQGLLALLVTSPDCSRSRRWLQDKLWSDRGHEQGAGSLRQALTEIRRSLGPQAGLLHTDRGTVALDAHGLTLDRGDAGPAEFLEGIDVRDPEFEAWLRLERQRRTDTPPPHEARHAAPQPGQELGLTDPVLRRPRAVRPAIVLAATPGAPEPLALHENLFIDCVARSLRETLAVDVYAQPRRPLPPQAIVVRIQAFHAGGGRKGLRVQAQVDASAQVLWTGVTRCDDPGPAADADLEIVQLGNQLIDGLADALTLHPRDGLMPDVLTLQRLAVRKIFSMHPQRMAEADALLAVADEMDPRGIFPAWRAQLRAFQEIERHANRSASLRDEADEFCARALERDRGNSMVLAVVAYARNALDPDPSASAVLARQSVELNPFNPIAWDSLSIARLYAGDVTGAHRIAIRVQRMGSRSPMRFWWDMGLCVTSALTGDTDLALDMAQSSAALAPGFHAALRYVTALHAGRDEPEKAAAAARKLAATEPGFSFDAMAHDPAYPVGALRGAGLLRSDKIRALSL